jgi:hypothetical protein
MVTMNNQTDNDFERAKLWSRSQGTVRRQPYATATRPHANKKAYNRKQKHNKGWT